VDELSPVTIGGLAILPDIAPGQMRSSGLGPRQPVSIGGYDVGRWAPTARHRRHDTPSADGGPRDVRRLLLVTAGPPDGDAYVVDKQLRPAVAAPGIGERPPDDIEISTKKLTVPITNASPPTADVSCRSDGSE
jgi:hypothetical protein